MNEPREHSYDITRRDLWSRLPRLMRPDNPAEAGWHRTQRLYLAARTGEDGKTAVHGVGTFHEDSFARAYVKQRYGGDGYVIPFNLLYGRRSV